MTTTPDIAAQMMIARRARSPSSPAPALSSDRDQSFQAMVITVSKGS
jgi:hypothetical protein